jgi:hypothetical protein
MLRSHYHHFDYHARTNLLNLHLPQRLLCELRGHRLRGRWVRHGDVLHSHYHDGDNNTGTNPGAHTTSTSSKPLWHSGTSASPGTYTFKSLCTHCTQV